MSRLWLAIEPMAPYTKLMLSRPSVGALLKARLPPKPAHPKAMALLVEALVAWCGEPLCAVIDVDAEEAHRKPEEWARLLGELDSASVTVEWSCVPLESGRDRFLGEMGDFRSARQLLTFTATGQR